MRRLPDSYAARRSTAADAVPAAPMKHGRRRPAAARWSSTSFIAGGVVDDHGVGDAGAAASVQQYQRHPGRRVGHRGHAAFLVDRDDQQGVDLPGQQGVDPGRFGHRVVVAVGEDHGTVVDMQRARQLPHESGVERVGDLRQDEADGACRAAAQGTGHVVGPVAETVGSRAYPPGGFRADRAVADEHPGHRGDGTARQASHVSQCYFRHFGSPALFVWSGRVKRADVRGEAANVITGLPPRTDCDPPPQTGHNVR